MPSGHGTQYLPVLEVFGSPDHTRENGGRFDRLFPDLDPFLCDPEVLEEPGAPDGPMATTAPPARTTDVPAGSVFFGPFIDHDITLDVTSSLDRVSMAEDLPNARTPTLDLDCVDAAGREVSSFMFDGARLVTAHQPGQTNHEAHDLPRVRGVALIGDFQNDENRVVSQLHLAMIRCHNQICDGIEREELGIEVGELFERGCEHCTWHYQGTIVREFLPAMCGQAIVDTDPGHIAKVIGQIVTHAQVVDVRTGTKVGGKPAPGRLP